MKTDVEDTREVFRGIVAGVFGGGVFILLLFIVNLNILISLIAAIGGFVAGNLLIPKKKPELDTSTTGGVRREDLENALAAGTAKLSTLIQLSEQITTEHVKSEATQICQVVKKILDDIRQDPKDLKQARQFLNYYLDATVNIMQRYVDLSKRGLGDSSIRESLLKTENILSTLRKAFEKQLTLLLQDDVMDLDTELELLKKTIHMEGLAGNER